MTISLYKRIKCKGDLGCGCASCRKDFKGFRRRFNIFNKIIRKKGRIEIKKELELLEKEKDLC